MPVCASKALLVVEFPFKSNFSVTNGELNPQSWILSLAEADMTLEAYELRFGYTRKRNSVISLCVPLKYLP